MSRKSPDEVAAAADELYASRDDPRAEGEVVDMKPSGRLSAVVSVRLSESDLRTLEQAAATADMPLSAFLRHAALTAARDEGRPGRDEALRALAEAESGLATVLRALRRSAGRAPS